MANTPEEIKTHAGDYNDRAWEDYSLQELGRLVHLLAKRSTHRARAAKRDKDLYDARNYLRMMEAHLDYLEGK
jgi:hypothetical protein